MPAVTAFQRGAQFGAEQEKRELDIEAGRRRERGINALAEEFGPGAQAPQAFGTVTGAGRAERKLISDLEKRETDTARDVVEQEQADVDRARAQQTQATKNLVGLLKQGLGAGMPIEELRDRIEPALPALNVSPEQGEAFFSSLGEDPAGTVAGLEAALRFSEKKGRGVFLKKSEGAVINGVSGVLRTFSDGSTEFAEGVSLTKDILSAERTETKQPGFRGEVKKQEVVGKARGKVIAGDLPRGVRETATAKLALKGKRQEAQFLDQTIGTAISQAKSDWVTGVGSYDEFIRGTNSADLAATVSTIKAKIGFAELARMRRESPTGGALGQVSNIENELLQAAWGALVTSQSKKQFIRNMETLRRVQRDIFKRVADQYEIDFGVPYAGAGSPLDLPLAGGGGADALVEKYRTREAQ